jgi:HPt (histidine-containing phosphotransfer) domain-containing protein
MNDYLAKPVETEGIQQALNKWVGAEENIIMNTPNTEAASDDQLAPIFDASSFGHRLMDDLSLQQQVATNFIADIPRQLASLEQAVTNQDAEAISSLAHRIKGAAANMSAERMRVIALDLEMSSKEGDVADADKKTRDLTAAFEEVIDVIKQELALS